MAPQPADRGLADLDRDALLTAFRETWGYLWLAHPYLVDAAGPLHQWLDNDVPDETVTAVRAIIAAVTRAGTPHDAELAVDILGFLVTDLRPAVARQRLGEFYTPPQVAEVMAAMTIPTLPPAGQRFTDPTAGTGGLLAATANRIRALGGDPADYQWEMVDLNYLSVACAAANALAWRLGDQVLVYQADTLSPVDSRGDAIAHRAGVLEHHRTVVRTAPLAAMLTHRAAGPAAETSTVAAAS